MQALKDVLAKSTPENTSEADVAEIKAAKEKLMESAQKLFTKMYEQAGAAQVQVQQDRIQVRMQDRLRRIQRR